MLVIQDNLYRKIVNIYIQILIIVVIYKRCYTVSIYNFTQKLK